MDEDHKMTRKWILESAAEDLSSRKLTADPDTPTLDADLVDIYEAEWRSFWDRAHPADLDAALQLTRATASAAADQRETRLPFAVDDALLGSASGELWAVRGSPD